MKFTKIATVLSFFALSACDNSPNFADLCQQHSEICEEFQEDTWCKKERIAVGFANLSHKLEGNDSNKYRQLISYEGYEKCMARAAKIEHIKLKIKKTIRTNNVFKAQEKIKEISLATVNSEHPDLLFFHWSRYLNEQSLNKFIALEGNELLEQPNRQVNLASYYAKRDPTKTLNLLYHALELYPNDAELDTEIFKSIASIFADKKEYKQVYIWSKILRLYDPKDSTINDQTLQRYVDDYELNAEFLNKVADTTLDKISAGTFVSPHT